MTKAQREDIRIAEILAPIGSGWVTRRGTEIAIIDYVWVRGDSEPRIIFGAAETSGRPEMYQMRLVSDFHADDIPGGQRYTRSKA